MNRWPSQLIPIGNGPRCDWYIQAVQTPQGMMTKVLAVNPITRVAHDMTASVFAHAYNSTRTSVIVSNPQYRRQ